MPRIPLWRWMGTSLFTEAYSLATNLKRLLLAAQNRVLDIGKKLVSDAAAALKKAFESL